MAGRATVFAAATLIAAVAAGFETEADFSVVDERGGCDSIWIERGSPLSHGHGWVEDGRYKIAVEGSRHFIAAPRTADFRLEADMELVLFRMNYTLGFSVFFRWDRESAAGHRLDVLWDSKKVLHFTVDGADVLTRQDADPLPLKDLHFVLDVSGDRGTVEMAGARAEFRIAGERKAGDVGFDLTTNESEKLYISKLSLKSPDDLPAVKVHEETFTLPRSQAFSAAPVYGLKTFRYPDGTLRLDLSLDGTVRGRPPREFPGGSATGATTERLTSPYMSIRTSGGERIFRLWNGDRKLLDPQAARLRKRKLDPWPVKRSVFVRDDQLDGGMTASAAGYEFAIVHPWRFAANGPVEQVKDAAGNVVYEGEAVRKGVVAFRVRSPAGKKVVSLVPEGVPERERAVKFAREQHCFFESEQVAFEVDATWRADDFYDSEIAPELRLETVFGERVEDLACKAGDIASNGWLKTRTYAVRLPKNPGVGVWHLISAVDLGAGGKREARTVFEVLPDDPDGPCPPLASGLPTLVSVPNEIQFLEENAFDPLGESGGVGHYYAIEMGYPAVASRLKMWELAHLYRRKLWVQLFDRNTFDTDLDSPRNRELVDNVDYLWHYVKGKHNEGRFDFCLAHFYRDAQLGILKDYVAKARPPLKLLTQEVLAMRERENKGLAIPELKDVFDTCWDDFKAYAAQRVRGIVRDYDEDLLRRNPKIARASYGPFPVYAAVYKTPYTLETNSHPLDEDPRMVANGSFWILEDYHYSCDYPLWRPALFVAAYKMIHPESRRIFPEIYYQGWGRCGDGAVYQAHPDKDPFLEPSHQRRIVYRYGYGTPFLAGGEYRFWTDDGFHARNPEREAMDEFVRAWGNLRANRPSRPLKSPFAMVDPDAFRRYGDMFDPDGTYAMRGPGFANDVRCDVINVAEEDIAWAYEMCCANGYATPVCARLSDLDSIDAADCEFIILPPIVESTPPEVVAAIRRAHARGIGLLCFEKAAGLEDLFPSGKGEFLTRQAATGRTALVNCRPTLVDRMEFKTRYSRGRPTLSARMEKGIEGLFRFLAAKPAVSTERGAIMASATAAGDYVVVLEDASPLYGDSEKYPATFRFTVSAPGIGEREFTSDAPASAVRRERDRVTMRASIAKDSAIFIRFPASHQAEGHLWK